MPEEREVGLRGACVGLGMAVADSLGPQHPGLLLILFFTWLCSLLTLRPPGPLRSPHFRLREVEAEAWLLWPWPCAGAALNLLGPVPDSPLRSLPCKVGPPCCHPNYRDLQADIEPPSHFLEPVIEGLRAMAWPFWPQFPFSVEWENNSGCQEVRQVGGYWRTWDP